MAYQILAINPGSTSTKVAWYQDKEECWKDSISHSGTELAPFDSPFDQAEYRLQLVLQAVCAHDCSLESLAAVVGRGGILPPIDLGGYLVNEAMIQALSTIGEPPHASGLGCMLAKAIAEPLGLPAFIYDAVSAGNLSPEAQITGMPEIMRTSRCHVLNSRAIARCYAAEQGKQYQEIRVVVAHLGGGITFSYHKDGRIVDSMADDDGAFSPERSGGIGLVQMVNLCFSGRYTQEQVLRKVRGEGGLNAHLGTTDCREIEARIASGDTHAALIYRAQALQIAKGIGVMAASAGGQAEAILLTGGLAYSKVLTDMVAEYVGFIAPVKIYPGENELEALAHGALRILQGEESARVYEAQA